MEPNREQIQMFVEGLFHHANPQGLVSVRAFLEGNSTKPFRISAAKLTGGLSFLVDVAEDDAYRAANYPQAAVFAPPIAVFTSENHARERNIVAGLTLSVKCNVRPREPHSILEALTGPSTGVPPSGGTWTDRATNEVHGTEKELVVAAAPTNNWGARGG